MQENRKSKKLYQVKMTRGYGLLENFLAKKRAQKADKLIPKHLRKGRVLDIGCGITPFFLINTKFKKKYGIDSSLKLFGENENIILKKFDVEKNIKLPFKDNFFVVITMLAVIEHLEPAKLVGILKEIKRVLKQNGRFILTTPCPLTNKLLKIMAKLKIVSPKEIEEHVAEYDQKSIIYCFCQAGFVKKNIKAGYFEFFLNNWVYADK